MSQGYSTIQRRLIFGFILENVDRHLTAEDVFLALRGRGHEVGRATVYRYLDKLTDDGVLRRYAHLGGAGAAYEYCGSGGGHPHLKCDACGGLAHLECAGLPHFLKHVAERHEFEIDPAGMVFHGICDKCKDREEAAADEKKDSPGSGGSDSRGGGFSFRQ